MKLSNRTVRRAYAAWAALFAGSTCVLGFVEKCDNALATVSSYADPCGTIFANCTPGTFEVRAADVGDYCVDPACTVPGQCPDQGQPLGTITRICP